MDDSSNSFGFDSQKLAQYLERHVSGFKGPLTAEKFSGGQSNPTFLIESASGRYVLRRKPSGESLKSAHAVDREFKVISALAQTDVPVARAYHLCEEDSIIGGMFYLMEFIDGHVMRDPMVMDETVAGRTAIHTETNRVLAALHSVKIEEVRLSDFGKSGNYFKRQVSRWDKQYIAVETETIADMETLITYLCANIPADDSRISLVHGDFRLDNMMFHPSQPRVLALADWELSTLGHPFADLAYQCMQLRMQHDCVMPGLGGVDREALGIPSEQQYIELYCQRMDLDGIPHWNFYMAFSFFRFASIMQGIKKRALDGTASNERALQLG